MRSAALTLCLLVGCASDPWPTQGPAAPSTTEVPPGTIVPADLRPEAPTPPPELGPAPVTSWCDPSVQSAHAIASRVVDRLALIRHESPPLKRFYVPERDVDLPPPVTRPWSGRIQSEQGTRRDQSRCDPSTPCAGERVLDSYGTFLWIQLTTDPEGDGEPARIGPLAIQVQVDAGASSSEAIPAVRAAIERAIDETRAEREEGCSPG